MQYSVSFSFSDLKGQMLGSEMIKRVHGGPKYSKLYN